MKPTPADRIACSVPFCRRTAPKARYTPTTLIICGKHWRLGDAAVRKLYRLARRKDRRWLATLCWRKVLRQATERSAGITG